MPTERILYSFRRCPYAIRARLALAISETAYELREVRLAQKPAAIAQIRGLGRQEGSRFSRQPGQEKALILNRAAQSPTDK